MCGLHDRDAFHTVHNYIDTDEMILRKGAIAAHAGELVLIPLNMRDGSVLARGRGNEDGNFSAPHGAGRLMSRTVARERLSVDEYRAAAEAGLAAAAEVGEGRGDDEADTGRNFCGAGRHSLRQFDTIRSGRIHLPVACNDFLSHIC